MIEHEPATVARIARTLGLARQSVQRVADALEAGGLVAYADNPHHRRARLVGLTSAGRISLDAIQADQRPWADRLGATIGESGSPTNERPAGPRPRGPHDGSLGTDLIRVRERARRTGRPSRSSAFRVGATLRGEQRGASARGPDELVGQCHLRGGPSPRARIAGRAPGDRPVRSLAPSARVAPLVQRDRRYDRRSRVAPAAAAAVRARSGPGDGHGRRRRPLRRARRAARCRRVRAPQPRLAAAHLGRRCLRHGDARLRGSERQSGDRRPGHGGRDRRRRAHALRPRRRRPGLRGCRRVARWTRRGHVADPRCSQPTFRMRQDLYENLPMARVVERLRRDHRERRQRQPVHGMARRRLRAGLAQAPGPWSTTGSSRRRTSSGRPARPDRSIRSRGCRRRP